MNYVNLKDFDSFIKTSGKFCPDVEPFGQFFPNGENFVLHRHQSTPLSGVVPRSWRAHHATINNQLFFEGINEHGQHNYIVFQNTCGCRYWMEARCTRKKD